MCTDSRSRAHGHTKQGRGGKPERSRRHKATRGNAKARNTRQQRGEVESPGKALVGVASAAPARALPRQLAQHQQSEPPLSPRVPTKPTTLDPRAREAPLRWHADLCQDPKHVRSDEDQKTATLGGIAAEGIHKTPGKRLAGDDYNATARPLPGHPARPSPSAPARPLPGLHQPSSYRCSCAAVNPTS